MSSITSMLPAWIRLSVVCFVLVVSTLDAQGGLLGLAVHAARAAAASSPDLNRDQLRECVNLSSSFEERKQKLDNMGKSNADLRETLRDKRFAMNQAESRMKKGDKDAKSKYPALKADHDAGWENYNRAAVTYDTLAAGLQADTVKFNAQCAGKTYKEKDMMQVRLGK